ncbi:UNVERIFIED_ORG: hypothetical protein DFS12_103387 [Chitinophaga ginsengisegetis]
MQHIAFPADNKHPGFTVLKDVPPLPVFILIFICMKYLVLAAGICLWACHSSRKVYQAPAVGAEAQFERGLRPEKHPKYLFDKKTMNDMQKQGSVSAYSPKRRNTAPTIPLPGKGANGKDSTNSATDSLHTNPSDSLRIPADSVKAPVDTTHIP